MINVNDYMLDGADYQARAVLAFLQSNDNLIEDSWNTERGKYEANINIGRWENCREQGYVLSMMSQNRRQINIAFFEHRNSDSIYVRIAHAVRGRKGNKVVSGLPERRIHHRLRYFALGLHCLARNSTNASIKEST